MECQNLDWDNNRDCHEEADFICECCGEGVCIEHRPLNGRCLYGGEGFIELE